MSVNIRTNIKEALPCFIMAGIAMLIIGLYSSYITKENINNRTFDIRTKTTLIELNELKNRNIKELIFVKSVFLMGSISNTTSKNFHVDKLFCSYLENDLDIMLIKNIEARTSLSKEEKNLFYNNFKLLSKQCQELFPHLNVDTSEK